ncbi:MAG: NRDE family protein [Planctomycetaceae bacterium]
MCVLICRVGPRPMLAANRDEAYARPFSPPSRWVASTPFWAPRDEEEGGTWLGVNDAGLFAAITNRSRLAERSGLPSRGRLVTGVLALPTAGESRAWLEAELRRAPRNPFQLLFARGEEAWLCVHGPEGTAMEPLRPGLHVLSNLHDRGEIDLGLSGAEGFEALAPLLADRAPRLPRGYAVNKDAGWRGTVASAFLEPGKRFLFAGGPPDRAPFEPVVGYPGTSPADASPPSWQP